MKQKKVLVVFGTRPEAIKMCPLVKELMVRPNFQTEVCVTGQHREMLDSVLEIFDVKPDYDLAIMREKQSLAEITTRSLLGMTEVLAQSKPDLVFVHGDTTTAFASSLAAFYAQIAVAHVEAGLRTRDLYSPFPEEYNRQAIGLVAKYHFAPTETAKQNLLREGKPDTHIYVTGNTGIDALKTTVRTDYDSDITRWVGDSRLLVITAHRRENLGEPMRAMFRAIRRIVAQYEDVKAVYPVHMNPKVQEAAAAELSGEDRIRLVEPLGVLDFHNLLNGSYLILTDSGGIQEEAPFLGKPVLVMRNTTERPEGVAAGTLKLVGTDESTIFESCRNLLENPEAYHAMAIAQNPYGDGTAARQICDILEREQGV